MTDDTIRRAKLARWERRAWKAYEELDNLDALLLGLYDVCPEHTTDDLGLLGAYARDVLGAVRAARAKLAAGLDEKKAVVERARKKGSAP